MFAYEIAYGMTGRRFEHGRSNAETLVIYEMPRFAFEPFPPQTRTLAVFMNYKCLRIRSSLLRRASRMQPQTQAPSAWVVSDAWLKPLDIVVGGLDTVTRVSFERFTPPLVSVMAPGDTHARPFVGAFQRLSWSHCVVLGAFLWACIAKK